ncbi:VWA domain-containing protein [uncultured Paraglaciecola sp.]|uniref:VWA domain-containing protein n=1 Tax=uncultured Paraglaciecola sp. TaxID=1765024 RepID=UPI002626E3B5|nr:VWA domain-containing protein [uncultured Paraglaciecola sp.]
MSDLNNFSEIKEIYKEYESLLSSNNSLSSHVNSVVEDWSRESRLALENEYPFDEYEQFRDKYYRIDSIDELPVTDLVAKYSQFCKSAKIPYDNGFWQRQIVSNKTNVVLKEEAEVAKKLLFQKWGEQLKQARLNWELETLNKLRQAFLSQLEELLKLFEELTASLDDLGVDPGIWLDLSDGNLTSQDIEQFKQWADYLKNDPMAQEICDLLGRMRDVEKEERIEKIFTTQSVDAWVPDINAKEEIVGIRLSQDIENVIPSELALLADPETSILFDLKFIENQLMTFDMVGLQQQTTEIEVEEEHAYSEDGEQGPMILCIDTSGSMHGRPETIAKAVSLFLATKAREAERPCYLINFSTGITTLDLSGKGGLAALTGFLSKSFRGGTDVAPALLHTLDVMKEDAYKKADVLVISDFIMGSLPEDILSGIEDQREEGSQFYSLVVGSCFMSNRLKTLFDYEWVYNPNSSSITELVNYHQQSGLLENKEIHHV